MSEVYSGWCFFKNPLSLLLLKGELVSAWSGLNTNLAIIKDAGVHAFPLWKGGPGGILGWTIFLPTRTYL
jgi:hypothetical protein